MDETIRTARLELAPLAQNDAESMVAVLADPALYEYTGGEPPTLEQLARRYRAQAAGSPDEGERWCNWIVRLQPPGDSIGYVQATVTDEVADVAWVIGSEWQGSGFATEAAAAMAWWLRRSGVGRLVAHIHPRHVASQRVAATLGLAPTGAVDDDGEQIWADGVVSTHS